MKYLYNEKTGKLHIEGYCPHSKGVNIGYRIFKTENEALAYGKTALSWCQKCVAKKEQILCKKQK